MRLLLAVLLSRCPRCHRGPIFKPGLGGVLSTNPACPVCGLRFEREAGYFLGAMYVSYGFAVLTILPVSLVLALVVSWSLWVVMPLALTMTVLCMPLFFRYSRVLWLHLDQAIDPIRE